MKKTTTLLFRAIVPMLLGSTAMAAPVGATPPAPAPVYASTTAADTLQSARAETLDLLERRTSEGDLPGYYLKADREAFRTAIDTAATTESLARTTTAYQGAVQTVVASTDEHEQWYYIVASPSKSYCEGSVVYDLTTRAGEQLTWNDRSATAYCMWKFVRVGNRYCIVNKATGRSIYNPGSLSGKMTSVGVLAGTAFDLE